MPPPYGSQNAYRPPGAFALIPPVVKNLLIINGLVFLAQQGPLRELLVGWFALWPLGTPSVAPDPSLGAVVQVPKFYPWQLVTCAFLHGGFGHLFFNMLGLWMFGMRIEHVLGSRRFAFYYFACVVGASLLQLLVVSAPFLFAMGDASI
ncbi:MAG TPA: rhomboid family intramembrane serine protease, partial [Rubricoccaceae bacterium]|nr:rhomboid family intramembrane serine protease [Rubricoccaceae bacterium]